MVDALTEGWGIKQHVSWGTLEALSLERDVSVARLVEVGDGDALGHGRATAVVRSVLGDTLTDGVEGQLQRYADGGGDGLVHDDVDVGAGGVQRHGALLFCLFVFCLLSLSLGTLAQ